jgi:potassium efflux system protein
MKELLLEVIGWLGYLERGPVVLQVLLMVALFALNRHWRRRPLLQRCPKPLQPLIGPVGAALVGLLLALGGLADGLLQFLVLLWLGWSLLDVLHGQLLRWLPESRVHQLQSRLLRPLYLLAAALLLINRLDSVNDLAVIPVGELFGVSLTLGKIFSAALLTYLLLVGSGPPAAVLAWLLQRSIGISDGSRKALELILRYSVVAIGITALCFHVGLNSTALLAIAGGLSVGLGFGIK